MSTFATTGPVSIRLDLSAVAAAVHLDTTDRAEATVQVIPMSATRKADLRAVERTRVSYVDGVLTIAASRTSSLFGPSGAIEVTIAVPAGSHLSGRTGMGDIRGTGPLGACDVSTGYGDVRLDATGPATVRTGSGTITVGSIDGPADITTGNGDVHLRRVAGPATVRTSNGDNWLGEVTGELRVKTANGTIAVESAHADVTARTANGRVRLGEVRRGVVVVETGAGGLDLGVHTGTAAWLDLHTGHGHVRSDLTDSAEPAAGDDVVRIRARTGIGDIVVSRV